MRLGPSLRAIVVVFLLVAGCSDLEQPAATETHEWTLDQRSWNMGTFAVMAELVDYGVKRLALSAALPPEEMDLVVDDAFEIAAGHSVGVYRETNFLVTDLFSAELTDGKHVLFLSHASTLLAYQGLKTEKEHLVQQGQYEGAARTDIARRFGKLLSYPDSTIEKMLSR